MNKKRVCEILKSKEKYDVFYDNRPVWIQEIDGNKFKMDGKDLISIEFKKEENIIALN